MNDEELAAFKRRRYNEIRRLRYRFRGRWHVTRMRSGAILLDREPQRRYHIVALTEDEAIKSAERADKKGSLV